MLGTKRISPAAWKPHHIILKAPTKREKVKIAGCEVLAKLPVRCYRVRARPNRRASLDSKLIVSVYDVCNLIFPSLLAMGSDSLFDVGSMSSLLSIQVKKEVCQQVAGGWGALGDNRQRGLR